MRADDERTEIFFRNPMRLAADNWHTANSIAVCANYPFAIVV